MRVKSKILSKSRMSDASSIIEKAKLGSYQRINRENAFFWVTYGQIFKDETREECAAVEEKENIAQPQKKVTHNPTQSHILDLSVKLFVLMPVHFFTFLFPR